MEVTTEAVVTQKANASAKMSSRSAPIVAGAEAVTTMTTVDSSAVLVPHQVHTAHHRWMTKLGTIKGTLEALLRTDVSASCPIFECLVISLHVTLADVVCVRVLLKTPL
jgi:nicotinate-nucleotide pyrophosphorylase